MQDPPRYLRTFAGHNMTAFTYARFPVEQLKKLKKFIKNSSEYSECTLDRCELLGLYCIKTGRGYNAHYMALRRFNGEDHWNITNVASHVFASFNYFEIEEFLKEVGKYVDLQTPKTDLEYIPPIPEEVKEKYTDPDCRGWDGTSSTHISKIEAREKKWLDDRD